jgi:NitT/TauT family transport system permease protein
MKPFRFSPALLRTSRLDIADILILLVLICLLYIGVRISIHAPAVITGPDISLSFTALPWYALLSVGRMFIAYLLSLAFTLAYGYIAARNRTAEKLMMPLLDVLQSVPILSFLPVVLLSLSVILPQNIAAELAAIVLIFTSQAWNMTYSFFQSVSTVPHELREAAAIFRLSTWLRFRKLELPFSALGLIWNSMMSWAGGWFFLMASEIFTVGSRDFRLPGIGAYLQTAASAGNIHSVIAGVAALVIMIILLDRLLWRPVLCWAEKFKIEMVAGERTPQSVVRELLSHSWIITQFKSGIASPCMEWIDSHITKKGADPSESLSETNKSRSARLLWLLGTMAGVIGLFGVHRIVLMLLVLRSDDWISIGLGTLATFLRVGAALIIALAWTVPLGVAIGTNRRMAGILQPVVQVAASIPATALFPVIVMILVRMPGGLNIAAVALMLLGTQWYLLFNVIAGAAAIPQDLRDTTALLRLSSRDRWRNLILPSLFPYLVTGAITAGGGAWNASIVAEHAQFGGRTIATLGIGSLIAKATGSGNYPLLLASTLALIITVVTINRLFWRRLYKIAENKYRME